MRPVSSSGQGPLHLHEEQTPVYWQTQVQEQTWVSGRKADQRIGLTHRKPYDAPSTQIHSTRTKPFVK